MAWGGQSFYHHGMSGGQWSGGQGFGQWSGGQGGGGQWTGSWQEEPDTILSKKMSQVLRHTAAQLGLEVLKGGFVRVKDLLEVDNGRYFAGYTEQDIIRIVRTNDKQRFALGEDERAELTVRANQGHTGRTGAAVVDEELLKEVSSAQELERHGETCVHGTYKSAWELIKNEGLKSMGRNHVHFAIRVPNTGEVVSGMRASCELFIFLDVKKALADGMKLYRSSNGVLLSRGLNGVIAPRYFEKVVDRWAHKTIWPPPNQAPASKALGDRRVPGLAPAQKPSLRPGGAPRPRQPQAAPKAAERAEEGGASSSKGEAERRKAPKAEVLDDWEQAASDDEEEEKEEAEEPQGRSAASSAAPRAAPRRPPQEEEAPKPRAPAAASAGSKAPAAETRERTAQRPSATRTPQPSTGGEAPRAAEEDATAARRSRWSRSSDDAAPAAGGVQRAAEAEESKVEATQQADPCPADQAKELDRERTPSQEVKKIEKKLREIDAAEKKASEGKLLTPEQQEKVAQKRQLKKRIQELKGG